MKKRILSSIIVVLSLFAFTLAIAPAAQAAYPEQDKVIEFLHHSSPGGGAGLFVLTSGDLLNKTGIVKAKIQTQTRQGGSSAVALNYLKSKGGRPLRRDALDDRPADGDAPRDDPDEDSRSASG